MVFCVRDAPVVHTKQRFCGYANGVGMELMPGYMRTEVGVIPEEWEVKRIVEFASIGSGGTPSREVAAYWGGSIPWVTTSQIDFGVIEDADQFITEEGLKNSAAKLLPAGTLLMALYGQGKTRGKVGILGIPAATNQACASIALHDGVSQQFILHYLTSRYEEIRNSSNSGSQENLNGNIVKGTPVALPPPIEQRAIAQALSDVDALLASLDQVIAKKRDLKQAAMQQLLTGKTRILGFAGDWEEKPLGEIAKAQKGQLITTKTITPGDIPVIAGGKQPAYFHASANRYGKTITVSASGASAGYIAFHAAPIFASDCSTISESDKYCIEFIYYALQLRQEEIYAAQTGGAQPHIQPKDLASILIKIPKDVTEQVAIAAVLSNIDAELSALEARRDKTRNLKQAMMQELLTGKTRLVQGGLNG